MALPDFFLLGAPKAGTTALHAALAQHPQLYLSAVKEPKFYLCDGGPPRVPGSGDRVTHTVRRSGCGGAGSTRRCSTWLRRAR